MKTIIGYKNQSLFDLAIQSYGSIEASIKMALENDLSVTDELEVGGTMKLPELNIGRTSIVKYYNQKNIKPGTGFSVIDNPDLVPDDTCNYCKLFE